MKRALFAVLFTCACGTPADGGTASSTAFDDPDVVASYVDDVIVPTYDLLAERADALDDAVAAFAADPTDQTLNDARDAWRATRVPWEQGEASLFGPVDSNGYDPALDSWPVNRADLDAVLGGEDVTAERVAGLDPSLKGFHTVEYLLFGPDANKTLDEFDEGQFQYLDATAAELSRVGRLLATSWTEGVDGGQPYAEVFRTAGEPGNSAYPSRSAAGQEIVGGIIAIADEVANGKLADPYNERDPTLVESQFSHNSLTDFQNNVVSIRNSYLGEMAEAGTGGTGLAAWVAERDPELDARVRSEIEAALTALAAIPAPFRDSITDDAGRAKVAAAIAAVDQIRQTFQQDIWPRVTGGTR